MRGARFRPGGLRRGDARTAADRTVRGGGQADVTVDGDDIATGRVILYDPAGNDAWQSTFRCVAYACAPQSSRRW